MPEPKRQPSEDLRRFLNDLSHAWVAYAFFEEQIPRRVVLPHRVGTVEFQRESQVRSVEVELGWAFFTRLEACLETHLHRIGVDARGNEGLVNALEGRGVAIPDHYRGGMEAYRAIRNALHHGDGDPHVIRNPGPLAHGIDRGNEIHLLRDQVEAFYGLFRWVAEQLDAPSPAAP
jgi:hypothetical protein